MLHPKFVAIPFLLAMALPAMSESEPMTPDEFADRVTGKTIYFARQGRPFGVEEYRSDQTVVWSFMDGICIYGRWYTENGDICFEYAGDPEPPECWHFFDDGKMLSARVVGADPADDLYAVNESRAPLLCEGPGVGV